MATVEEYINLANRCLMANGDANGAVANFNKALSVAQTDREFGDVYFLRGALYMVAELKDKAIADYKKAADYGNHLGLNKLKEECGINYTPQKPSSSPQGTLTSNPYGRSFLNNLTQQSSPPQAAQPVPTPASNNVWEFNSNSYVNVQEVYKSEGARVKKGEKLLKYDGKVLKSEVDGIIDTIPPFSQSGELTVRIIIGK